MNFWEFKDLNNLFEVINDPLYTKPFFTLYYSGATKKGEFLALTWKDINFKEQTIDINKTAYNRQITKPKTKASNQYL